MSYFDDMYERGLVDQSGMPTWDDEPDSSYNKTYNNSTSFQNTNLVKESIKVSLTPDKYLDNSQQYKRSQFLNNQLSKYNLEIFNDNYNENDTLALKVYCDGVMIGYVQKYDNPNNINEFAFKDKKLVSDIEFIDNTLMLYRYLPKKENLTDEKIKKYVNSGLTKCGFYNKYKTAYISYGIIIPKIKKNINKLPYQLRTTSDYKQFIEKNYELYEHDITESTKYENITKELLIIMEEILNIIIFNNKVNYVNEYMRDRSNADKNCEELLSILDKKYHIYCNHIMLRRIFFTGTFINDRIKKDNGEYDISYVSNCGTKYYKYHLVEKFKKALEEEDISLAKIESEECKITFDEAYEKVKSRKRISNKYVADISLAAYNDSDFKYEMTIWDRIKSIVFKLFLAWIALLIFAAIIK